MILPAWQNEILQSDVQSALYIVGAPVETAFSLLYSSSIAIASAYNDPNRLMYHNLAMGSTNSQTAKQAIYDRYAAGTNLNLGNWASYNNEPNIILTWTITNNNTDNNINGTLYIIDTSGTSFWNYTFNVNAGGGTDNQTNYDTGISVSVINTKYAIALDATAMFIGPPPPPGGGVTGNTTAATDTDGVGGGTARFTFNPANFDMNNPLPQQFIVNGTAGGTADIALNKRTSFDIVFN